MADLRNIKCPRCKTYRYEKQFIAKDRVMKTCEICRDRGKKYADQNRDKMSDYQKHWRTDNPEYFKQNRDEHKLNNPLQTKFKKMINNSTKTDKKYNLQINEDYITIDFLNELFIKQNGLCFYQDCECILDYESFDKNKRNDNQITIQRHDNNICHSQNNTCLSCFNCNVNKRKEREHFTEILIATNKLAVE